MTSLLLALACACPAPEERFTPGPDPAYTFLLDANADRFRCADGEWVSDDDQSGYYLALCRCGWCADAYAGNDYCVRRGDFDAWVAWSCPSCNVGYGEFDYDDFVYVDVHCDAPDCDE